MIWINRTVAVLLVAVAVPLWQQAEHFPGGASIFPKVILMSIVVLALIMLGRSFVPALANPSDGEGVRDVRALGIPLIVFGVSIAGAFIMWSVGFFPAALFIGAVLFLVLPVGRRRLYATLFAATLAFVYVLFVWVLRVPLI